MDDTAAYRHSRSVGLYAPFPSQILSRMKSKVLASHVLVYRHFRSLEGSLNIKRCLYDLFFCNPTEALLQGIPVKNRAKRLLGKNSTFKSAVNPSNGQMDRKSPKNPMSVMRPFSTEIVISRQPRSQYCLLVVAYFGERPKFHSQVSYFSRFSASTFASSSADKAFSTRPFPAKGSLKIRPKSLQVHVLPQKLTDISDPAPYRFGALGPELGRVHAQRSGHHGEIRIEQ